MASFSFSHDPRLAEQEMHAVIFYLNAFGYIDGQFDPRERAFVRGYIARMVEQRADDAGLDTATKGDVVPRLTQHFHEVMAAIDAEIAALFTESVGEGEETATFVLAKLKLRAFELFQRFDEDNRARLLSALDELMVADGVVDPREMAFRNELYRLLLTPMAVDDADIEDVPAGAVVLGEALSLSARADDHPFLTKMEWPYADDAATFGGQAKTDLDLMRRVMEKLDEQRAAGKGRLATAADVSGFAGQAPFLDGHVYVVPPRPDQAYELLVLGDLHGCYACLKAALMQADFFAKVQAYHDEPAKHPDVKLIFLGDYIDRGRFSYAGILRAAMKLFVAVPDHVYLLRGNHEHYVEFNGRTLAPVRPAEAYASIARVAPNEVFEAYRRFFEALPNMLFFDRTMFVHAGIPRDATLAERWKGLPSLNDPDIRFQMLWSDPSDADAIPDALQQENARFPFGRRQFKAFMGKVGATTMIRGHERVVEGFREVYAAPEARLLSLFSAGGAHNADLPAESNYREVTPMALTITHRDGVTQLAPFALDYARYNDPALNAFFREGGSPDVRSA
jgi:hypothetical protein